MKFEANQIAYGDCPECNSPLLIKFVGKNTFIGCSAYPKCEYSQPFNKNEVVVFKEIEDSTCPECSSELAVKKGRYGMFIGCTNFPSCHFISTNKNVHDKPQYEPVDCPLCNTGKMHRKQNRFGKFFYACDNYPKCKYIENVEPVSISCPQCSFNIMLKKNKALVCANPDCQFELKTEQ